MLRFAQTIKFNVMLTTYEVLISDVEELSNVGWLQVIVDEGHRIKNKSSKILEALQMINCNRRLLLTGTPVSWTIKTGAATGLSPRTRSWLVF